MLEEDGLKKGERAVYREERSACKVEILENLSNRQYIEYKLKVLKNLKKHPLFGEYVVGEEFTCSKYRYGGYLSEGLWKLRK